MRTLASIERELEELSVQKNKLWDKYRLQPFDNREFNYFTSKEVSAINRAIDKLLDEYASKATPARGYCITHASYKAAVRRAETACAEIPEAHCRKRLKVYSETLLQYIKPRIKKCDCKPCGLYDYIYIIRDNLGTRKYPDVYTKVSELLTGRVSKSGKTIGDKHSIVYGNALLVIR